MAGDALDETLICHLKEQAEDRKRRREEATDEDHFGRHAAAVLKWLPNRAKAMAKLKIEQVLVNSEFPDSPTTQYSFEHMYHNFQQPNSLYII